MDNDSEIIQKCLQGDKNAFGQLVEKYKRGLYGFAYQMTRSHEDADDLSQEAFLRAYENLNNFKPGTNFHAWIFRILHNLCLDQLRKANRFHHESIGDAAKYLPTQNPRPDQEAEAAELRTHIHAAVKNLPQVQRTVVILREMQGLSHREIAEITKTNEKTVRWRLHQARKKLREMLKDFL
jgi:RNA polymerase sigma-70 factor (ECF subfamily)